MKNQTIRIHLSNIDEALHLQNLATRNVEKYKKNHIEGQEHLQSALVRMWRDVHNQAGQAVNEYLILQEQQ
ncbi:MULTISPECIES: hypothetical protein [unclassified Vibrio]|uniref:hypothetical protein n=1 Tax=unclassified Vibrio TaxID=2614977 RepID=UPI001360DE18|nr:MULTISPECIES: hypothetical protein [unclassified Vibrio]NAW58742.1 hypothetical protein [Vibrio sp. V36_P2S2PM302]NAX27175.1 hypothetical protein [Vibrio sp. V38_P2S17PM301]NAX31728.1 hypothetical protein [Vibrio sp. V37_P2S8PM304]